MVSYSLIYKSCHPHPCKLEGYKLKKKKKDDCTLYSARLKGNRIRKLTARRYPISLCSAAGHTFGWTEWRLSKTGSRSRLLQGEVHDN